MAQEKRMASIIYRKNKWRAQIRKQDKTLAVKKD